MPEADNRGFPKLNEAQSILVGFLVDHPNMVELAESLGPFFRWMRLNQPAPDPTLAPLDHPEVG